MRAGIESEDRLGPVNFALGHRLDVAEIRIGGLIENPDGAVSHRIEKIEKLRGQNQRPVGRAVEGEEKYHVLIQLEFAICAAWIHLHSRRGNVEQIRSL